MLYFLLLLRCWPTSDVTPLLATRNKATFAAIRALNRRPLPPYVREELTETPEAGPVELRRSFLMHLQQQHLLPLPPGSVVVEWPRSGEQFMVDFYLLRRTETGYAATLFQTNGSSPWQTGNRRPRAGGAPRRRQFGFQSSLFLPGAQPRTANRNPVHRRRPAGCLSILSK